MNSIIKQAAGDQEFEQAFFQLAYDKLQGKLSNLIPFLIGFQLVKKVENGTKAVGVFGFKSNNGQIIFVPSFFINGKIKEMELMYSRNNNQFYPLNEDFAELFLKDDVTGMGEVSQQTKEEIKQDVANPNMRNVIWPPRTGRISYAEAKDLEEQNHESFGGAADLLLSKKSYDKSPELTDFLKDSDNQVKEAFFTQLSKNAEFTDAVRSFYSDESLAESLRVAPIVKEAKERKLRVVDFNTDNEFGCLPDHNKKELVSRGHTVVDKRDDKECSDVGIFKYRETFSNPVQSGFYPYITEMGTIRHGLVLMNVLTFLDGYDHPRALVLDLEAERKGQAYETDVNKIFIKDQITVKDISGAMHLLEEPAESLPSYDDYVLINENLKVSEPFNIIENYKDHSGIRRIKIKPTWYSCNPRPKNGKKNDTDLGPENGEAVLIMTKKTGDRFEYRNRAIYIPKGFKLLKLHIGTSYYPSVDYTLPREDRDKRETEIKEERARIRQGKPGNFYHLAGFLRENNTFPLTVHTNGSDYFMNVAGAKVRYENHLEAKCAAITEVGLREKDAEALWSNLTPNCKKHGYVKVAATGDHILSLQDENAESNELGQPTYYGIPWVDMHDSSDGYTGDPTQMGLGVKPDEGSLNQTINQAVQLAQSGQKEIFDTQTIAALSKYTDSTSKVLQYVPTFVSSLDKLGRMLFLTYWDTDTFEKMYGRDELPELIELVKNVFNNLGDLIIFLKRKIPDISINDNEQSKNDA